MVARSALGAALFFLLLGEPARAAWTISSSETEPGTAAGIERRHVVVSNPASGDEATLEMALFSSKAAAVRVVDNPGGAELSAVAKRMRSLAGVNGGYFDPQNQPVGLLISDGKTIAPFRKARLLSGLLVVNKGRVELVRSTEYFHKSATAALQCGPFLVDGSSPVPGLNNVRSARRTFFVSSGSDRAGIGFCSSVTLAELGDILSTPHVAGDLKVQRGLNFDGGSSSAFWFAGKDGPFSIGEYKTVRNFVIVAPK